MPNCPSCKKEIAEGLRFCGHCGANAEAASPTAAATATSAPEVHRKTSSGEAGRFAAGTVIAQRYRIVGLLGRGGMGEVYRADDLKLGRPVALKFLPGSVEQDPARLNRLLNEVRTALSVSHPNVCRVHDVHEEVGRHFITMEFVDGDDLSALLRRIGRLPQDKALEIARQLCAGLGAAHAAGVLHRDLKPANIMIDGRGQVKITDFGLAGLSGGFEGTEVGAGTPAYMAPEQLAGKAVTEASDLYSLGLVLYEIYTGKPAHQGATPAEIARKRLSSAPTTPSSHITDIDPAVERVILRCLEREPADRPPTALAVSAALPGGDPLAAALAAGETPAPELVAEAGAVGGLSPPKAWTLLSVIVLLLGLSIAGAERYNLVSRAKLPRSGPMLQDDARKILASLGYDETLRGDSIFDFDVNWRYLRHVDGAGIGDPAAPAAHRQPAGILFNYRQGPTWIRYEHPGAVGGWLWRSPPTTPGALRMQLDPLGRLLWLDVVSPERPDLSAVKETDWQTLLDAAGFDPLTLNEVEPEWLPPGRHDQRRAWKGEYPDAPEIAIRIEAASTAGRPVAFRIIEPWTQPRAAPQPSSSGGSRVVLAALFTALRFLPLVGGVFFAWRNVRLGRGDRRTALRFSLAVGGVRMAWYLFTHHVAHGGLEFSTFVAHLDLALRRAFEAYILYLAIEPYARKLWPRMLTSWVRLFDGRFRDPLVGRDVLTGIGLATGLQVFGSLALFVGERFGLTLLETQKIFEIRWGPGSLRGLAGGLLSWAGSVTAAMDILFMVVMAFLIARLVMRRDALVLIPWLVIMVLAGMSGSPATLVTGVALAVTSWFAFFRLGFLVMVVFLVCLTLVSELPLTYDLTAWWAAPTWITLGSALLLAIWSFRVALAGQPVFRDRLLEG